MIVPFPGIGAMRLGRGAFVYMVNGAHETKSYFCFKYKYNIIMDAIDRLLEQIRNESPDRVDNILNGTEDDDIDYLEVCP